MKWSLLTVFLRCWPLLIFGLLLVLFVSTWLEGPESVRVAAFAAPFWAAILCVRARTGFWQNLKLGKAELERQIPCSSNPEPSPRKTATAKEELNPAHVSTLAGLALIGGILLMVIGMSQTGQSGSLSWLWVLWVALSFLGGLMMFIGAMILAFIVLDRMKSPVMIKAQWSNLDQLCAHLRQMGLDATVESQKEEDAVFSGGTIGTIRIANLHIDVVEFARAGIIRTGESDDGPASEFWCTYVVQAKVEGWEDGVIAEGKPVKKSLLSRQIVDYHWEGTDLAQTLNNDYDLRNAFISLRNPPSVRISKGLLDIRIFDKGRRPDSPEKAFPTIEIFNAYDKIAQHIRSIARAS